MGIRNTTNLAEIGMNICTSQKKKEKKEEGNTGMILTRRKIESWNNLKQNLAQILNAEQQQQINSRQWCSVVREDCLVAGTSVV